MQRELTALEQEIEKQTVQLREWQMQELLKLRQQLHALERQKQQAYLEEVVVILCGTCIHLHRGWLTGCLLSRFFPSFLGLQEVEGNGP